MRLPTLLGLATALALLAPSAQAQCTGTAGTDFQRVTVREINQVPQSNIDQLNAAGADLTTAQIATLVASPFTGQRVEFTAVLLSDPLKSGLASAVNGVPGRIHVFMRDTAAETEGVAGQGIQIVDNRGDGTIQQFFVGDQVTVCGEVTYFNATLQLAPESINAVPNPITLSDATLAPVVVETDEIHDTFQVDGTTRSQVDWSVYSDFVNQFVRFESAELLQGIPAGSNGRPNMLFSTSGDDATIRSYDTSVCFRNDRGPDYFPPGQEPACNQTDFTPPPTGIVNVQGFLTLAGTFDAFTSSVPPGGAFAISPFEDADFEIAVAPPIITLAEPAIPTSASGAALSATVTAGTAGNTVSSVVATFTTSGGGSGQVTLSNGGSGNVYTGTITGLAAGQFVTYTVTATDDQNAAATTQPVTRRVLDGPVSSIFDVQVTPDGGVGASGVTTSGPVAFDLDARVQSAFQSGNNYYANIQDDPTLGPFSGVWVFFGTTDPGLQPGDRINVSEARVEERFELTQLSSVTFTETGSGDPYPFKDLSTVAFNGADGRDTAEQHEGMSLSFANVTVVATNADAPSGPFGEFLFSSDGTVANALRADDFSAGVSYGGNDPDEFFDVGEMRTFVRGALYFSFSNYKLAPATTADFGERMGTAVGTGPGEARVEIVGAFPNPTAGDASVRFSLAEPGPVALRVFDATGREVATVAARDFSADTHDVTADLSGLASGVYVVRLEAGGEVATTRVAIVR